MIEGARTIEEVALLMTEMGKELARKNEPAAAELLFDRARKATA